MCKMPVMFLKKFTIFVNFTKFYTVLMWNVSPVCLKLQSKEKTRLAQGHRFYAEGVEKLGK